MERRGPYIYPLRIPYLHNPSVKGVWKQGTVQLSISIPKKNFPQIFHIFTENTPNLT